MFEPGAKVVCTDGKFSEAQKKVLGELPIEGATYTVRDIVPGVQWGGQETVAVYLSEITGITNNHGIERGWDCRRFRELDILPPEKLSNKKGELIPA